MEKESKSYDDIILSREIVKGMSLNINDQVFFKRVLDRQDELTQEYISEVYAINSKLIIDTVREMLNEQKMEVFEALNKIERRIEGVEASIEEIIKVVDCTKQEVKRLKEINTLTAIALRILIGVGLGILAARWLHGPLN
jgi:adenylate kinase